MSTGSGCATCGVGFILPSGKCDHCNVEFKHVPETLLGRPIVYVDTLPDAGDIVLRNVTQEDASAVLMSSLSKAFGSANIECLRTKDGVCVVVDGLMLGVIPYEMMNDPCPEKMGDVIRDILIERAMQRITETLEYRSGQIASE